MSFEIDNFSKPNHLESEVLHLKIMADTNIDQIDAKEILNNLECPVCYEYITPPVKQCLKGHLVCNECFPKLKASQDDPKPFEGPCCPTCRGEMSQERNNAVEKIALLLKYPCRYLNFGCEETNKLSEKDEHEKNCQYSLFQCPFHQKCTFNRPLKDVETHLKATHKVTPVKIQSNGIYFYR